MQNVYFNYYKIKSLIVDCSKNSLKNVCINKVKLKKLNDENLKNV